MYEQAESDYCPICGEFRGDGFCPWEDHTEKDLMKAMAIEAAGGGVIWAECVLAHDFYRTTNA